MAGVCVCVCVRVYVEAVELVRRARCLCCVGIMLWHCVIVHITECCAIVAQSLSATRKHVLCLPSIDEKSASS